ncbi:MAG: hypothetical protein KDC38_05525, partial [Planctomycetes bacterium]|nr:hypothetical protein [Planctomycetota bacterium]
YELVVDFETAAGGLQVDGPYTETHRGRRISEGQVHRDRPTGVWTFWSPEDGRVIGQFDYDRRRSCTEPPWFEGSAPEVQRR